MPLQDKTYHLKKRILLHVTGEDAKSFLQNVITNDMEKIPEKGMIYTCLLSPQGQILNEFFVFSYQNGYMIDIDQSQIDGLMRRLTFFKLRAKVSMERNERLNIYAGALNDGFEDTRYSGMGRRCYTEDNLDCDDDDMGYADSLIHLGIPNGFSTIQAERDVVADANLDILNAVAFDKGCFIGQEVVARMYHRNLSRKRLLVIQGENLAKGQALFQGKISVGEVRDTDQTGKTGLALIKLTSLSQGEAAGQQLAFEADGNIAATLQNPAYAKF